MNIVWRIICAVGIIYFMIAAHGASLNKNFPGMVICIAMTFLIYKSKDLFKKKESGQ
jgi:uncharacterized membrane protein